MALTRVSFAGLQPAAQLVAMRDMKVTRIDAVFSTALQREFRRTGAWHARHETSRGGGVTTKSWQYEWLYHTSSAFSFTQVSEPLTSYGNKAQAQGRVCGMQVQPERVSLHRAPVDGTSWSTGVIASGLMPVLCGISAPHSVGKGKEGCRAGEPARNMDLEVALGSSPRPV